ncbi:hypothetical protein QVD17_09306 [Tagetes erecta]|uniref:Uncharacterized protein n=1 Tax=Tagetes erecta TaxID=13708 RepID=A0AAD8KZ33_TARER|nr:hypothetical protein QVD17_09306 [Tagetes erecta]
MVWSPDLALSFHLSNNLEGEKKSDDFDDLDTISFEINFKGGDEDRREDEDGNTIDFPETFSGACCLVRDDVFVLVWFRANIDVPDVVKEKMVWSPDLALSFHLSNNLEGEKKSDDFDDLDTISFEINFKGGDEDRREDNCLHDNCLHY